MTPDRKSKLGLVRRSINGETHGCEPLHMRTSGDLVTVSLERLGTVEKKKKNSKKRRLGLVCLESTYVVNIPLPNRETFFPRSWVPCKRGIR